MKTSFVAAAIIALGSLSMTAGSAQAGSSLRIGVVGNGAGGGSVGVARGAWAGNAEVGAASIAHVTANGNVGLGRAAGYTVPGYSAGHVGGAVNAPGGGEAAGRAGVVDTPYTITSYAGGVAIDPYGNAVGGVSVATDGAFGHTGFRAGSTTHGSSGYIQHVSGFAADGNRGTGESTGAFAWDGLGTINGSRTTDVTTETGSSYEGSTSYAAGSGMSHEAEYTTAYGTTYTWSR